MLVGSVIDNQFDDDLNVSVMCRVEERFEVVQCAVIRLDVTVIRDVVAVILVRLWESRKLHEEGNSEIL